MTQYPGDVALHQSVVRVCLLLATLVLGCRLVPSKGEVNISPDADYRCGIFNSHIYETGYEQEVYPDLGIVLANYQLLDLTDKQRTEIGSKARQCYQLCTLQKEQIRLKEEKLKRKLKHNEPKGDFSRVSKELNDIEAAKKSWLDGHKRRYEGGLYHLHPFQQGRWVFIEQMVRPFEQ